MKKLLIVLVLLFGFMFATNPDKQDFVEWTKDRMKDRMAESSEENGISEALRGTFSELGGVLSSAVTTDANYYLFSVYTVDLGSEEYRYLGLFKTFIPLQAKNPLKPSSDEE